MENASVRAVTDLADDQERLRRSSRKALRNMQMNVISLISHRKRPGSAVGVLSGRSDQEWFTQPGGSVDSAMDFPSGVLE